MPAPTFCPECRMIRRMCWRNVRSLHRRECGLCSKALISMYKDDGAPVYCKDCYEGDSWDPFSYNVEYDFNKNFFIQLKELFYTAPRFYKYGFGNLINSDYTNFTKDNKNCYLAYSVTDCEDVMYSETIDRSKNSLDCYGVQDLDNCSYNIDCQGNFNSHYAIKSESSIDSYFIYDCKNCSNCYMSHNLRSQQYVFKNQKLSKEKYKEKIAELGLETYNGFENAKNEYSQMLENETIHKYAFVYSAQNWSGDYIHDSKNVKSCFDTNDAENVAYSMRAIGVKDSYDLQGVGFKAELIYESVAATANTFKDYFCYITLGSRECEYSLNCKNCSNCFACVSLTGASYCIFNKQYSKEDYFTEVEKIKKHMDEMPYVDGNGRVFKYGEFFPYDMSPFGYNETNAHDFFPITKEEAKSSAYNWFDKTPKDYGITINSADLPNSITDVDESIMDEIIGCPNNGNQMYQCASAYKIVPDELLFYRQKKLPLPRFCPNCRHYQRLKYRNQMHLYTRQCSNCTNIFESTYAQERPEKVYCESCYNGEVL